MKFYWSFAVGLCLIVVSDAQWDSSPDDDTCSTPDNKSGTCIPIKTCKFIVTTLNSAPKPLTSVTVEFLQSYHCGFEGNTPKVCCPPETETPKNTGNEEPPDVSRHKNLNLINSGKCGPIFIDKIYGGNKTSPFEFPWMALIAYNTRTGLSFRCGGSVINERYILTAAHCITNLDTYTVAGVRLGEHDISKSQDCDEDYCAPPVQDFTIAETIAHPLYNPTKLENDIGLIRLNQPANLNVETVKPICLPTGVLSKETLKGRNGIVAGWGATESGYASPDLLKVSLPVISNDDCQVRYNQTRIQIRISAKQMCAGGVDGKDSCSGDSGGPLKYMGLVNNDSRFVQYGIVSFGPKFCGMASQPGVYTKVGYYMDWILDNMKP